MLAARVCVRRLVFAGLVSMLPVSPAIAAEVRLRLADVLDEARRQNPSLLAARERAEAAAAIPRKASAWDDPVVSWEAWNAPEPFSLGRADNNILKLSQKIPFPGKRSLAGRAAGHDAEAAADAVRVMELDLLAEVTRAYWDLWQAHHRLAVFERERTILERIAHVLEKRYGTGDAAQAEVLRMQVERSHARNRVLTEELAIDDARTRLAALLSRPDDLPLGTPEEPTFPTLPATADTLVATALGRRPELAAQAATIAREDTNLRLARKGYLPDFELAVEGFINYRAANGVGAMASMTIPLAFKGKYDAGVAEARARLASAEAERRRIEDTIRREVRQAFLRVRTALLEHKVFVSTHLPQAEQALRVTDAAYQTGDVDFVTLLESVRAIETAHLDHIGAAAEVQIAYTDLQRAIGAEEDRP